MLTAPTGAGKTVIATSVVEAALDEDPDNATFLWVTDDPSLNRQTLQRMMAASSSLALNRLVTIESDFDEEVFAPGKVYFLNIQKLSVAGNLSKSQIDGRTYSLWETIANTIDQRPRGFVIVVDEAHRGLTTVTRTRETIVSQIIGGGTTPRPAVPVVWGISATPGRFISAMAALGRNATQHTVAIEDVRASGLLKDQIILGHTRGVTAAESTLVRHAVRRVREYDEKWLQYTQSTSEPHVHPALVVQIADKPTAKELADLMAIVLDEWPELSPPNIVHTFADHTAIEVGPHRIEWCAPEDIQDRSEVRIVLCKTAITTGWDCPRAEVLLSLRVANDVDAITQVMGRMVRAPLARRVLGYEDLNAVHCILPKFKQDAVDVITDRFKAGNDEYLAGGSAIVLNPIELAPNAHLTIPRPRTAEPAPTSSAEAAEAMDFMRTPESGGAAPMAAMPTAQAEPAGSARVAASPREATGPRGPIAEDLFSDDDPAEAQELHRAPDYELAFRLIEELPSYVIPTQTARPPIERLFALALLLASEHGGQSIQLNAPKLARNALFAVISNRREDLEVSGELEALMEQASRTHLYERAVAYGRPGGASEESDTVIDLDSRGISILLDGARKKVPQGLVNDYINYFAGDDTDKVHEAIRTMIALASDPQLPGKINARAADLVEEWFVNFGTAITRLPAVEQERFDQIKQHSDRPLPTNIVLPVRQTVEAKGRAWERHLVADADGLYRPSPPLNDWEEYVLKVELDAGALAWYRNPARGKHALRIPYQIGGKFHGMAPDFIFLHQIDGELVASLIDPHGTNLNDAAPKLRGLAKYSEQHGSRFHRVQSVAKVDGAYRMLDLLKNDVKSAISGFSGDDASDLFRRHGVDYH